MIEGQNRGFKLDNHIFSSVTDTIIYSLEINTKLASQEKVASMFYFTGR